MKRVVSSNSMIFNRVNVLRLAIIRIHWLHQLLLPVVKIALLPRRSIFELNRMICYRRFRLDPYISVTQSGIKSKFLAISNVNYWDIWRTRKEMTHYIEIGLKAGDVAYDIGSNVGTYTVPMAKYVGLAGSIIAFEPDPMSFGSLLSNLKLNEVGNCITTQYCIGNENREIDFYVRPEKDTHSIFEKSHAPSPTGELFRLSRSMRTLDDLVQKGEFPQPNFIKLDIEGAELLALDGMSSIIREVRAIYIECHNALKVDLFLGEPVPLVTEKLYELGAKQVIRCDSNHVLGFFK